MAPKTSERGLPLREILVGLLAIVLLAAGALVIGGGGLARASGTLPVQGAPPLGATVAAEPPDADQAAPGADEGQGADEGPAVDDGPGVDDGLGGGAVDTTTDATGLDPELLRRFRAAQAAALEEGIPVWITSGWRSAADQQALLDEAVAEHGSLEEAVRWVLPPERSAHVQGTAIDVGGWDGMTWLDENGAQFGLCRVYQNEGWHFEATTEPGGRCPELRTDASEGT